MSTIIWTGVIGLAVAIYLFYRYMTANFDYFKKRGLPFAKPIWGAVGNNIAEYSQFMYNQLAGEK